MQNNRLGLVPRTKSSRWTLWTKTERICLAPGATKAERFRLLSYAPWFRETGKTFMESCAVGNGRLGGLLFGGLDEERIVLNESTVWSGGQQDADAVKLAFNRKFWSENGENYEAC